LFSSFRVPRAGVRAVVWHGDEDVRVDDVADPVLADPTDAIIRITGHANVRRWTDRIIPLLTDDDPLGVLDLTTPTTARRGAAAKPGHTWIGNSCHVHSSLWRDGANAFGNDDETFTRFLAGQIACTRELALFFAPNVNSYKRYAAGSWAPTTLAWGHDNRTCGFCIVGHGGSKRVETRMPGGT
jgi:hypothetical protein